jgi:hypothetical protein
VGACRRSHQGRFGLKRFSQDFALERAQVFLLIPAGGGTAAFHGTDGTFSESVGKKAGRAQGDCCKLLESGKPKWKPLNE